MFRWRATGVNPGGSERGQHGRWWQEIPRGPRPHVHIIGQGTDEVVIVKQRPNRPLLCQLMDYRSGTNFRTGGYEWDGHVSMVRLRRTMENYLCRNCG